MIIMHRLPYLALVSLALVSFALLLSSCGGSGSSTDDPTSPSTAARRVDLAPGDQCAYGGVLVQTGIDENRNGTLDDDEVDASEAVCNGLPSLLKRTVLEPGDDDNCPAGGEFIESGIDANGNGTLEASEVDDSAYLCDGQQGDTGSDGLTSLIKRTVLIAGDANCPAGGEFVETGIDDNGNGTLEPEEVDASAYLCHSLSLLYAESEQPLALRSKACPLGGLEGQFGIDANGNGTLDAAEVNAAIPVDCNTEAGLVLADEVTADRWSARADHSSVVFDGKLWMLGGYDGSSSNDVWSSEDGVTWEEAAIPDGESRWSARYNHSSVVFNSKLWVIGGRPEIGAYLRDVWSSEDGASWTQATATAGWSARAWHASVAFNSKLWVLGGFDGSNGNEVWSSLDGAVWTNAAASSHWSGRSGHSSVVFNNKLWVLGGNGGSGNYFDDVWSSSDGATWMEETADAGWSARRYHSSVVYDDKLWVIGGRSSSTNRFSDVWSSSDGASWIEETPSDAHWSARSGHSSTVFDGHLWVLGGFDGNNSLNDVWVFAP